MSKKKEGKVTAFYCSELACQKQRLNCHSSPLQLCSSFFPLFYDILLLEPKLMFLIGISNMLIPLADIFFQASTGLCSPVLWPYS